MGVFIMSLVYIHVDTNLIDHVQGEKSEFKEVVEEYKEEVFPEALWDLSANPHPNKGKPQCMNSVFKKIYFDSQYSIKLWELNETHTHK